MLFEDNPDKSGSIHVLGQEVSLLIRNSIIDKGSKTRVYGKTREQPETRVREEGPILNK